MDLREADLREADLHGVNLRGVDLREANFHGAHLNAGNLSRANLRKADLSVADLHKTDLSGANLHKADLSGADLREADLRAAHLRASHLIRADVSGSILWGTTFADMDLRAVKGLDTVWHKGPSTIGIDTIHKSKGQIPEIFLRGAGVPEPFIVHMKALVAAMNPIQFYSCFISYSHADKPFARALHDTLQGRGIRCWLDEKQLLPGDDLYEHIDRGIRLWDKLLLCCSEHSLKPDS